MTAPSYSVVKDGQRQIWTVKRLWELSRELPRFDYEIARFGGFEQDCWYGSLKVPTIRSVLEHIQRIEASDLSYPILLSRSGEVMDGVHRICKAWLAGLATLPALQFAADPPPCRVEPWEDHA